MKLVINRLAGLITTVFLVFGNAILIEQMMDLYGVRGHRLLTGIIGTLLVILSFGYSMRKKKLFKTGGMKGWLRAHEWLAIAGTVIIFVHTGIHFHGIVAIITLIFMFIAFISGLIGRYVYDNVKAELRLKKAGLKKDGLSEKEIEDSLTGLATASEALSKWRTYHMPVISILGVMVLYHAIAALYYGGFKI
ncbi:MAG: hypothetical protein Q7T53_00920 [Deltaproteobacteria bacterium]|nr:hypothetical protein [Deltaproteobacteria bacterium]